MQCEHLHYSYMEINNGIGILVRGYKFSSIRAAATEISSEPDWLVISNRKNKKLEQTTTQSMMFTLLLIAAIGISQLVTATSAAYVKTGECTVNFKDQSKERRCMILLKILFSYFAGRPSLPIQLLRRSTTWWWYKQQHYCVSYCWYHMSVRLDLFFCYC